MARSSTKRTSQFGILMVIGVIVVAYLVYAFTVGPLRPEASDIGNDSGVATEIISAQPFLTRSGTVSSFSESRLTVDEPGSGSFTVELAETSVVRTLNSEGLFEISDRSQLTDGDTVVVYYSQVSGELTIESVDIIVNN